MSSSSTCRRSVPGTTFAHFTRASCRRSSWPFAIIERTDALNWQGDALCDLAEVLHAAGRSDEAAATLEQALERYERKKNLPMAAQVRERLAARRKEEPV